jgi:hypothetical protein
MDLALSCVVAVSKRQKCATSICIHTGAVAVQRVSHGRLWGGNESG